MFRNHSYYTPSWGGLFALLLMYFVGLLVAGIVLVVLMAIPGDFASTYGTLITYPVQFVPIILYVAAKSRSGSMFLTGYLPDNDNFGRVGGLGAAVAAAFLTIGAALMTDPLMKVLPEMPELLEETLKKLTEGPVWLSLLCVSLMAPFFEEWLCRGVLLRGLLQHTRPIWAILASAAFFAFIHMNPWQALPAFVLGCLFGYVYYKTGSLKLTMLMHCVNNTMAVIISNIPALKDADSFSEVLPMGQYIALIVCGALLVAAMVWVFSRIPLSGERSSCESVPPFLAQSSESDL